MSDAKDDDPLEIKNLAVTYDYLMYRINDHISNLSDLTHQSIINKKRLVEEEYFGGQLKLDEKIAEADKLMRECTELEMLFLKLDQLYLFVGDFKTRLLTLESEFKRLT